MAESTHAANEGFKVAHGRWLVGYDLGGDAERIHACATAIGAGEGAATQLSVYGALQ